MLYEEYLPSAAQGSVFNMCYMKNATSDTIYVIIMTK